MTEQTTKDTVAGHRRVHRSLQAQDTETNSQCSLGILLNCHSTLQGKNQPSLE